MEELMTGDLVQARLCPGRVGRVSRVYGKRVDVRWIASGTVCGAEPRFFVPVRLGEVMLLEVAVPMVMGPKTLAVVAGVDGLLAYLATQTPEVIALASVRPLDRRLQPQGEWVPVPGLLADPDSPRDADVRATVPS